MKILTREIVCLMLLAGTAAFAQDAALSKGTSKPVVDGAVGKSEYTYQSVSGPMTVSFSRTAETLYVAVSGATQGWVAIGLGSRRMNNSVMFIGYVSGGKASFNPQIGQGHSHDAPGDKTVESSVISSAVKEENGKTTMEFALKAANYIAAGQAVLSIILAQSPADQLLAMHSYMGFLDVALK